MNKVLGQIPNRAYLDPDGDAHLNGSTLQIDEQGSNITVATQAAARTYTIPHAGGNASFVMTGNAPSTTNGISKIELKVTDAKAVTGAPLAATATGGAFGFAVTLGTSLTLIGETSNNSSKTDSAIFELVLPNNYIAGSALTITVNAGISTAGSPTYATKTVQALCYPISDAGAMSADIGPGTASAITVAGADVTFAIAGSNALVPGQRIFIEVQTVLHDTAGVACNAVINSVRLS